MKNKESALSLKGSNKPAAPNNTTNPTESEIARLPGKPLFFKPSNNLSSS